jgi:hypothetical protein
MALLILQTQYKENYGDEDNPYWKYKGGSEYLFPLGKDSDEWSKSVVDGSYHDVSKAQLIALMDANGFDTFLGTAQKLVTYSNPMSEEYVLDSFFRDDDYLASDTVEQNYIKKSLDGSWVLVKKYSYPNGRSMTSAQEIKEEQELGRYQVWEDADADVRYTSELTQ